MVFENEIPLPNKCYKSFFEKELVIRLHLNSMPAIENASRQTDVSANTEKKDPIVMSTPLTFAQFLETPETHSALIAVREVAKDLAHGRVNFRNPLLIHGPTGTGKTHLMTALTQEVSRACSEMFIAHVSANDFRAVDYEEPNNDANPSNLLATLLENDLVIIEDLQHLPVRTVTAFIQLLDSFKANNKQMLLTANAGPQQLQPLKGRFPARLLSRLSSGTAIRIDPLQAPGRKTLLKKTCAPLSLSEECLNWLAQHLTGGTRQLLAVHQQLQTLREQTQQPLTLDVIRNHYRPHTTETQITVERITEQVSQYYRVKLHDVKSAKRYRDLLLPRQVSMYLARELTPLSLQQIGTYFGGRDHTTVLHACRKVKQALLSDYTLSGTIQQLQADLL